METLQRLDGYSLTRDDLVECLNGAPFQDQKSRFELIPSKTRASFTRKYNSTIHQQANIFAKGDDLVSQKQRKGKRKKSDEVQGQEGNGRPEGNHDEERPRYAEGHLPRVRHHDVQVRSF